MFRLFVGIPLPDDIRESLGSLCAGLPGAKWVDPDMLHITLRFIGEVDGAVGEDVHDALTRIGAPMFDLAISGIDCFEQKGKVHTLWAGIDKQPLLSRLRDKVESAMVRIGLDPDRRKYKAHVTLARFRDGASERLGTYLHRYSRFYTESFTVDHFALFRSHLSSGGAHYEVLMEYPLQRISVPLLSPGNAAPPAV